MAILGVLACALFSAVALAEDVRSGDWTWSIDDPDIFYAGTENAAGNALMQFCYTDEGSCVYAVGFDMQCEEGSSYPALVNTDVSAASIDLLCGSELDDGSNFMFVKDFDQIDGLIRKAGQIGFALPMKGDEFKAVRFSLKGSVAAIDAMRTIAERGARVNGDVKKARDSEVF
jgi:hypothetical protein